MKVRELWLYWLKNSDRAMEAAHPHPYSLGSSKTWNSGAPNQKILQLPRFYGCGVNMVGKREGLWLFPAI